MKTWFDSLRIVQWAKAHPFLSIFILLICVFTPGIYQVEHIATDAQDTANEVRELQMTQELDRCRNRNSAQRITRQGITSLVDVVENLGGNPTLIEALRNSIPPEDLEVDCNSDDSIDEKDYT